MNKNVCKSAIKRGGRITPLIIPSEFTNGLGLMNPSILKVKNKYLVNIRWVGYALYHSEYKQKFQSPYGPLVYLNPEDDVTLTTVNYKCELDIKSGKLKKYQEVNTKKLDEDTGNYMNKTSNIKLCKIIQQARNNSKQTQKQLAQKLQINVNDYNKYESGSSIPDTKLLLNMQRKLKVKLTGKSEEWGKCL